MKLDILIINEKKYVNVEHVSYFYNKELRNESLNKQQYNKIIKDLKENYLITNKKDNKGNNFIVVDLNDFREVITKEGIDENKTLKKMFTDGLLIPNTQGKFKHSTYKKGERVRNVHLYVR